MTDGTWTVGRWRREWPMEVEAGTVAIVSMLRLGVSNCGFGEPGPPQEYNTCFGACLGCLRRAALAWRRALTFNYFHVAATRKRLHSAVK